MSGLNASFDTTNIMTTPKKAASSSVNHESPGFGLAELFSEIGVSLKNQSSFSLRRAILDINNNSQMWCILTSVPNFEQLKDIVLSLKQDLAKSNIKPDDWAFLTGTAGPEALLTGTRSVYQYLQRDKDLRVFAPHVAHTLFWEAHHDEKIAGKDHITKCKGIKTSLDYLYDNLMSLTALQKVSKSTKLTLKNLADYFELHIKILNVAIVAANKSDSENFNSPLRGNKFDRVNKFLLKLHPYNVANSTPVQVTEVRGAEFFKRARNTEEEEEEVEVEEEEVNSCDGFEFARTPSPANIEEEPSKAVKNKMKF